MPIYYPLIKWKRGEKNALRQLTPETKNQVMPIFEFQPDTDLPDQEAVLQSRSVCEFCTEVTNCWGTNRPYYLDINYLDVPAANEDNIIVHPLLTLLRQSDDVNLPATPILWSDSSSDMLNAVRQAFNENLISNVAIRLVGDDSIDADNIVTEIAQSIGMTRSNIDIIFDMEYLDGRQSLNSIQVLLSGWQENLGDGFRRTILLAGSMPENLWELIAQNNFSTLPRREWQLWNRLRANPELQHFEYGDYTTVNPLPLGDTSDMRPAAKIKYTLSNQWLIARGERISRAGGAQHYNLAGMIANHHNFRGPGYSYGDTYIHDCANRLCGPGNSETWVTVGVNQHITFVVNEVNATLAAPLGTP